MINRQDEFTECETQVINGLVLKTFAWIIGMLSVVFNIINGTFVIPSVKISVGSQLSLFSMTALGVLRLWKLSQGLPTSDPVKKKSQQKLLLFASFFIAMIPLFQRYEDTFVTAMHYPDADFLNGFYYKDDYKHPIDQYYGRMRHEGKALTWKVIRKLIQDMFTNRNRDSKI